MNSSMPFLIGAGVIAVISIPMILKMVPPNPIYGFRTPATLSNRALWYQANTFAGWALLIGALVSAVLIVCIGRGVLPEVIPEVAAFLLPMGIAVAASFVYVRKAQACS